MGGTDVYGGEKCALERLGLGDPGARLNGGVERDGDGRQDADDRDDDHQLDEREASLIRYRETFLGPAPMHGSPQSERPELDVDLLPDLRCSFDATLSLRGTVTFSGT